MRYKSEFMGAPFEGVGYWGYNTASGLYESVLMTVPLERKTVPSSLTAPSQSNIIIVPAVSIHTDSYSPLAVLYQMFFGEVGQEVKSMEIVYTRA